MANKILISPKEAALQNFPRIVEAVKKVYYL